MLKKLFGRSPASSTGANLAPEQSEELLGYIQRDVSAGFLAPAEIVEAAVDVLGDGADHEALLQEARRLTVERLRAHLMEQDNWRSPTDCDKLDDAFTELERIGIVARQNFSCCGTCGTAEIGEDMSRLVDSGQPVRGYAFYHMQDTESAVEGHGLYLNYGAAIHSEPAALAIGREIVEVLARHGLSTRWDGTLGKRIGVTLDWKRRRHLEEADIAL